MDKVIDVKDVWLKYKDLTVLEGVNLSIEEGDFLGIIGPNG
ncbi:ABC transporter, partial [Methanococcoides sp. SA1]|nr:ABC transporter [Methanococcoides sp. SA1]